MYKIGRFEGGSYKVITRTRQEMR